MNIITKKVRLVPAPVRGSVLTVNIDEGLIFKIRSLALAEGRDRGTIDWGDTKITTVTSNSTDIEHIFPATGQYLIKFSDDFRAIGISYGKKEYTSTYAPMTVGFFSDASRLTEIPLTGFYCCTNLARLDVSASAVEKIDSIAFAKCSALEGELSFPKVATVVGSAAAEPFMECTGITALHFASENEAAITASTAYTKDPTLGTGVEDVCVFDL